MATPRVAAGAIIRNPQGQILIVKPAYKHGWDIPGGYVEPGESPASAYRRELREELDLDRPPGRLLLVDWAPHPDEGDKLLFVFDGGELPDTSRVTPDGKEISEVRFVDTSAIAGLMPARLARRITTAAASPTDPYAESGLSVSSAR
jgi:8-oxo-dGTP diphosphatase